MSSREELLPQLRSLLPLDDSELKQILNYSASLPPDAATQHLTEMLGDSPEAAQFIMVFNDQQASANNDSDKKISSKKEHDHAEAYAPAPQNGTSSKVAAPAYAPPPGPPPDAKSSKAPSHPPAYVPPPGMPPTQPVSQHRHHQNIVTHAAAIRAQDEQEMQNTLQVLQYKYNIYNSDIEPEHETEYYCSCDIHQYKMRKWSRYGVQDLWSKAVMYPGEKAYTDNVAGRGGGTTMSLFSNNPYINGVMSPYGRGFAQMSNSSWYGSYGPPRPIPSYYTMNIQQTIQLNNSLNADAQSKINAREPKHDIWAEDPMGAALAKLKIGDDAPSSSEKYSPDKKTSESVPTTKSSKLSSFRKSLGIKNSEERAISRTSKEVTSSLTLRQQIVDEERGRWPNESWHHIIMAYQQHVGMASKIRELRQRQPLQYLHLLRAGYFEPIPVAWATQASNPLKFSIESSAGWRGITPAWRGYEDTAEERLYWVLNHREGSVGMRMKPDFMSEMQMARDRMARAVEPPPAYYTADDTCHIQHTSDGYSKQVLPPPFKPFDRPESPTDDTMILLDISGSMDFSPQRPVYQEYLITSYTHSTQPKNKDVAKAIVRRFTDAMAHHDHLLNGYDLVTFSSKAQHMGSVTHQNLNDIWTKIKFGGGTRVMTGWQQVKELHFQKHSESATFHPVYGWQAGPQTPILRLLLLLDGEATDMDEFELDLLGLSWAHVTIFLIGVDGCPHHHRHANELERISNVNHHVSFVDAQGNFPERFVTHELLKRHLGYDISMQEFEQLEELPAYSQF